MSKITKKEYVIQEGIRPEAVERILSISLPFGWHDDQAFKPYARRKDAVDDLNTTSDEHRNMCRHRIVLRRHHENGKITDEIIRYLR